MGQHDDGVDMHVRAGDITVFDLGRPQRTYADPSRVLSLVVPREARLPQVTLAEAPSVVQATTQMLVACLCPSPRTMEQAREQVQGVTLARIHQHIARNLGAPLSPELLCRSFRAAFGLTPSDVRAMGSGTSAARAGLSMVGGRQHQCRVGGLGARPAGVKRSVKKRRTHSQAAGAGRAQDRVHPRHHTRRMLPKQ